MNITHTDLTAIIVEEAQAVLREKRQKQKQKPFKIKKDWEVVKKVDDDESDTERKRRVFQGYEDIDKLSKGIIEFCGDEEKEINDEEEEEIEEMNVSHNSKGEFTSPKDSTCDSSYFLDKQRKGKKKLSDKDDTGRGKNKNSGKGRFRCKDNEPLWESKYRSFKEAQEEVDIASDEHVIAPADTYECAKELQKNKVLIRKLKKAVANAGKSGSKKCPLSYDDAVRVINQLELASKGKAYGEPNKND